MNIMHSTFQNPAAFCIACICDQQSCIFSFTISPAAKCILPNISSVQVKVSHNKIYSQKGRKSKISQNQKDQPD
jgi:hypothetical protein